MEKYGLIIDVAANRPGLLHVLKVRALYGKFIDGQKGLIEAGLERGARVRLCVESVEKRRLSLDFTNDVKLGAKAELEAAAAERSALVSSRKGDAKTKMERNDRSTKDVAPAPMPTVETERVVTSVSTSVKGESEARDEVNYDDDDDDYDEDRDIEDSLGLGFY